VEINHAYFVSKSTLNGYQCYITYSIHLSTVDVANASEKSGLNGSAHEALLSLPCAKPYQGWIQSYYQQGYHSSFLI
jgi:hypothetical protein